MRAGTICDGELGDEIHLLYECTKLDDLRTENTQTDKQRSREPFVANCRAVDVGAGSIIYFNRHEQRY